MNAPSIQNLNALADGLQKIAPYFADSAAERLLIEQCVSALRSQSEAPVHPTGCTFETFLSYQPWCSHGSERLYTADTVKGAWIAGAQSAQSEARARVLEEGLETAAKLCEQLAGWELIDTKASQHSKAAFAHAARQIRALASGTPQTGTSDKPLR
jgi:hypothetical protein